ncbi:Flavin prenyltransferase UbiX [Fundidesulfovibrio magnetotacticus]|uniref:Flavin prenyltransferase UbiX n=1 Tax=Fundidesulfovibrio magnetotacticus TaxID=2730080 RepID=A0A6V8LQ03_9BACT|nr:UbiX family flavin prenyltransferase [Fundidesulfovibrio magnetotacticus]GFK94603.1 Flavin prenyltransferase UbiX [Fundidesulfovibrio magnetotacticus]
MRRLVVGISGASGVLYGVRLLEALRTVPDVETHLVVSKGAELTLRLETDRSLQSVQALAHVVHDNANLAASISSGSFPALGMAVVPCSMKSLAQIALSLNDNLLTRAADVTLKERRKLVIVPRETPLHLGHLRHMTALAETGAVILPPAPSFYHGPQTIMDIVDQTVGKVLDQFGLEHDLFRRWSGAHGA